MKLVDYLGKALKSDDVLDLLERNGLEVVYEVDRLREGAADQYQITDKSLGFQMMLDENQNVQTIFCYVSAQDAFSTVDPTTIGVPILKSIDEVKAASESMGCEYAFNEGIQFLGREISWAKLTIGECAWHYEFENGALCKITLMHNWSVR